MATNRLQSWELVQAIKLEDQPHIKTHHRMAYALRDLGRFKEANDVSSLQHLCLHQHTDKQAVQLRHIAG